MSLWVVFCWVGFTFLITEHIAEDILGPGDLKIKSVNDCSDGANYENRVSILKHKVNRTFETFKLQLNLKDDISYLTGVYINVAKWGDGGYKPNFGLYNDVSFCGAALKYAKKQFLDFLDAIQHSDICPIKAGHYRAENYVLDWAEIPPIMYGDFRIDIFLNNAGKNILCLQVYASNEPKKTN